MVSSLLLNDLVHCKVLSKVNTQKSKISIEAFRPPKYPIILYLYLKQCFYSWTPTSVSVGL